MRLFRCTLGLSAALREPSVPPCVRACMRACMDGLVLGLAQLA